MMLLLLLLRAPLRGFRGRGAVEVEVVPQLEGFRGRRRRGRHGRGLRALASVVRPSGRAEGGASQHRVYYTAYPRTKPLNQKHMSSREPGKLTQCVLIRTIIICEAFHRDVRHTRNMGLCTKKKTQCCDCSHKMKLYDEAFIS